LKPATGSVIAPQTRAARKARPNAAGDAASTSVATFVAYIPNSTSMKPTPRIGRE